MSCGVRHRTLCSSDVQIYLRALFDYNPRDDELIPCSQAGVSFNTGDILKVRLARSCAPVAVCGMVRTGHCHCLY